MKDSLDIKPEEDTGGEQDWLNRISAAVIIIVTLVVALMLTTSACRAYGERTRILNEYNKLTPRLEALETKVDRKTSEALKRLDPDYQKAEYKQQRGILSPGEELLPIYDENEEE